MSTADLFDINPAGSDSHMQFMNWTVDNNGAWDYAADTRGYTYGVVVEYQGPFVEARYGLMLMPTVANGETLDWDIGNEPRREPGAGDQVQPARPDWAGTTRLLGYLNHADDGELRRRHRRVGGDGVGPRHHRLARRTGAPSTASASTNTRSWGRCFAPSARIGWNDGKNESFAYTEVDNTFEIGGDVRGTRWRRPDDRIGLAFVSNGISDVHAEYLRRGGIGFLLGDGPGCSRRRRRRRACPPPPPAATSATARETIVEQYYNFHVWRGAFAAEDVQFVANPGYNSARGPVWVLSLRGHLEF